MTASSDFRSYVASSAGACVIALVLPEDPERATAALRAARRRLLAVPHPEEPDDPFVSYASDVTARPDGALFWFDAADVESYPGVGDQLVDALVEAATDVAGGNGELLPAPDVRPVSRPRVRPELPPDGFPVPDFVVVDWVGGSLFTMATESSADDIRDYFVEQLPLAGFNIQEPFAIEGALPAWTFRGTVIPVHRDGLEGQLIIFEYGELLVEATPEEEAEIARRRAAHQPARLEFYWGSAPVTPGFHDFR